MGEYTASPGVANTSQADANSDTLNVYHDDFSLEFGDTGTLAGPEERECMAMVFDLSQSGGIAKTAEITDVTLSMDPLATQTLSGGDAQHRLALMEPNGQWDRPTSHALHQSNSGNVYGAPSRQATARTFRGENQAGSTVFDTSTASAGFTSFETSAAWPSWGCTFELPANEELWDLYVDIARVDTGTASKLRLEVYELEGDGRHFAVKRLLKRTKEIAYDGLVLSTVTETLFTFFGDFVEATASDRWLAVVVAGEIFDDGSIQTTHRLKSRFVTSSDCDIYRSNTEGSLFRVSDTEPNDNSLNDIAYPFSSDIPHIYDGANTNVLTNPFSRVWTAGSVLSSADASVVWTVGVTYKYGSLAGSNIFAGIVAEFQAWIDSNNYDPDNGRHFIGLMLEPFDPDDEVWPVIQSSLTLTLGFTNKTHIRTTETHARARIAAAGSSARERIRLETDARSRIFSAAEARQRIRPARERVGARIRAPLSYARSHQQ